LIYLKAKSTWPNIVLLKLSARRTASCSRSIGPGQEFGLLDLSGAEFGQAGQFANMVASLGAVLPERRSSALLRVGPLPLEATRPKRATRLSDVRFTPESGHSGVHRNARYRPRPAVRSRFVGRFVGTAKLFG